MAWDMIGTAVGSINSAIELAKSINSAGGAIERAELQLKLADMMSALAEAKIALAEAKEDMASMAGTIAALENSLARQSEVVRKYDAYYEADEQGAPMGDPYCSRCWEVEHVLIHLTGASPGQHETSCKKCKSGYPTRRTPFNVEKGDPP